MKNLFAWVGAVCFLTIVFIAAYSQSGVIDSTKNTTTTPLNAGNTYTGTWELNPKTAVAIYLYTDQAGTLYVDFSKDGSNVDATLDFAFDATTNEVHNIKALRPFYRIRITNTSASNQTYLRAGARLGDYSPSTSSLSSTIQQDQDAQVVRAIDSETDIAQGNFAGHSITNKVGLNPDIDTGTPPEDICGTGGVYSGFPESTLETVTVVSSSANDAAAGTGARTIRVTGLDANYAVLQETITLNGLTPVNSVAQFRRIHTAMIMTAGSGGVNAGTITCNHTTTTANVFFVMQIGTNQTNESAYTVPAGYTAYVKLVTAGIRGSAAAAADLSIWTRSFGGVFRQRRPFAVSTSCGYQNTIYGGIMFTEKSDIILRCTAMSANNTVVFAGYDLILIKN